MTHTLNDIELPVVANIDEAEQWAKDFQAILTVGPSKSETHWGHPNHKVWEFADTSIGMRAPKYEDIVDAVKWGAEQEDLLVHCHAGMSRSTSTAWGISIARGADPEKAFLALKEAQPEEYYYGSRKPRGREFIPNRLIVKHLCKMFDLPSLEEIRLIHSTKGW